MWEHIIVNQNPYLNKYPMYRSMSLPKNKQSTSSTNINFPVYKHLPNV